MPRAPPRCAAMPRAFMPALWSGRSRRSAPDAVSRYSTSPMVHRSGGRTPRRMSSCRRAATTGWRPTLRKRSADALRPDGVSGLAWQGVGHDQQRMARLGHVASGRRRHVRAPLRIVSVAFGRGMGEQGKGRAAVGCQRHRLARSARRVGISRRGEVQTRLEQITLRGPGVLALRELVDDPLSARDVMHLEQHQPDLDARRHARAGGLGHALEDGRGRRPITRGAAPHGLQQRRTPCPPRSRRGEMRDGDHRPADRPAVARREDIQGAHRATRLVHAHDRLDPAEWARDRVGQVGAEALGDRHLSRRLLRSRTSPGPAQGQRRVLLCVTTGARIGGPGPTVAEPAGSEPSRPRRGAPERPAATRRHPCYRPPP